MDFGSSFPLRSLLGVYFLLNSIALLSMLKSEDVQVSRMYIIIDKSALHLH